MMTAIALDDESPALEIISAFCRRLETIDLVKTFTRTAEARLFLKDNPIDLLFLDINMPKESGLVFAKASAEQTLVIFTTAYSEYAAESYEVEAVDYLLKPFTFSRFEKAVQRAHSRWQALRQIPGNETSVVEPTHLYLRVEYGLVKVIIADIVFIEGLDNYLKIHFTTQSSVVVRLTMKAMLDKLPATNFLRVHRSFIIALDKIRAIRGKMILVEEEEVPVGSSYEKDVFSRFTA